VIKGLEGAIVGFLNTRLQGHISNSTISASISGVVGGLEMITGYFLYEISVLGYPLVAALVEVPFNLVQMTLGLLVAIPVMACHITHFPTT